MSVAAASYYTRLKFLWEEIATMTPSLPLTEVGREYNEYIKQQKLYKFLSGLNESYGQAKSQILLMCPLPSINQAYAMVIEEEQ